MKKICAKVKKFYERFKGEKWFRYITVLVVMVVMCLIVSVVDDIRHKDEKPPDTEETSIVSDFVEDSAVHVLLICGLAFSISYVKHSEEICLKEKK